MPPPHDALDNPSPGDRDRVLGELEAAWERWARGNSSGDARIASLLRAAFAAGFEAGHGDASREH